MRSNPITLAMTEREFQDQVVVLAELMGWITYHTYDSRRSASGFPDLVMVRPPRVLVIELKTEKGRLTADQKLWGAVLELCPGVDYRVWRPSSWDEIEEALRRLNRLPTTISCCACGEPTPARHAREAQLTWCRAASGEGSHTQPKGLVRLNLWVCPKCFGLIESAPPAHLAGVIRSAVDAMVRARTDAHSSDGATRQEAML